MPTPRFRIRTLMIAVAVVAAWIALILSDTFLGTLILAVPAALYWQHLGEVFRERHSVLSKRPLTRREKIQLFWFMFCRMGAFLAVLFGVAWVFSGSPVSK